MPSKIDARLAELGITLPRPPAPAANYVPFVVVGQDRLRLGPGQPRAGRAHHRQARRRRWRRGGRRRGARPARTSSSPSSKAACGGDLDRVKRVVKLTGFVNSAPDFTDQPQGGERLLRRPRRRLRRGRPARPLGGRRGRAAARRRRSRWKVSSRSPELPAAFLAAPLAHRGLHDRAAGVVENSRAAFAAAIAAGYGIEMDIQRSARRRGDGLPRRRDAAADRPAGAGARLYRRAAVGDAARSAAARPCRRSPRCWRWWRGARRSSSRSRTRTARSARTSARSRRGSPSSSRATTARWR